MGAGSGCAGARVHGRGGERLEESAGGGTPAKSW